MRGMQSHENGFPFSSFVYGDPVSWGLSFYEEG